MVAIADDHAAIWDSYASKHADAALYHLYAWREVIQRVFKLETHYLAAFEGERICGVLPLGRQKSLFFGDYLTSLPYFNYGGACADHDIALRALIEAARSLGEGLGVQHIELRHSGDMKLDLPCRTDKISMMLDLPETVQELSAGLKAKVRAQVKRPEREGASIRAGRAELIPDFYRIFARNMRDLGTPVYPRRFFEEILNRFPEISRVFVVDLRGSAVAAGIVLAHGRVLEIPWASSLREFNRVGANMYLYWQILSWAIENGFETFDFGRCSRDGGTYRFKKQWGSRPVQLHWHYLLYRGREMPALNHANPKYEALIRLWQKQPVALANMVSPLLAKHLP